MRSDSRISETLTLLPLLLLGAMLVLGLILEPAIYGTLLWETKIPLAVLLLIAFFRKRLRPER